MSRPLARSVRMMGVLLVAATVSAGCGFGSVNDLPLPARTGTDENSFTVTVDVAEVANLVPNAEVMVNDVRVGTVTETKVVDWHARLTVGLQGGTELPANAVARVGQKSLLGAEYLELAPPTGEAPQGRLVPGATIGLDHTGRYPETEELLGALSVVLNGSGLQQVRTVTSELDNVFDGRQQDIRSLIHNLQTFVGGLDRQRGDIVTAIDSLNRLSGTLNKDNAVLAKGIEEIPGALQVLNEDREALVDILNRLGILGNTTVDLVGRIRGDLRDNLAQIRPAVQKLADSGKNLTESLESLFTFPFPASTSFPGIFRGDYGNLFLTLDLSPEILADNFRLGFGALTRGNENVAGMNLLNVPPLGSDQDLQAPLAPLVQDPAAPLGEVGDLTRKGGDAVRGLLGGGR